MPTEHAIEVIAAADGEGYLAFCPDFPELVAERDTAEDARTDLLELIERRQNPNDFDELSFEDSDDADLQDELQRVAKDQSSANVR